MNMQAPQLEMPHLLPHRGYMLLVDAVQQIMPGGFAITTHQVCREEPCFSDGRTGQWPRTLLTEFIGQTAALLCAASGGDDPTMGVPLFAGARDVYFTRGVHIGDVVVAKAAIIQRFGKAVFVEGTAHVADDMVCHIREAIVVYVGE